jgi:small subunit ribosomal protein S8
MNFSTIKFLIQLKNASILRKERVELPFSNFSFELVKSLYKEGLIQSFDVSDQKSIKVTLRFFYNKALLKDIRILSTPSLVRYLTLKDVCRLSTRKSIVFLSTNKGILTQLGCKQEKVGGTVLFAC